MKEIVIIGAGNFGRETSWLIEDINRVRPTYNLLGFLDDTEAKQGKLFNGYPCLGKIPHLLELCRQRRIYAVIAMESCSGRRRIASDLADFQDWETLRHPSANIAESAQIGQGCIICAHTSISIDTKLGKHCLINIGTVIGHDSVLGDCVSVMPGVCICGNAVVKDCAYLGTNCSVTPKISIGAHAKVGAGSAVLKDVADKTTVLGVPAKSIAFQAEDNPGCSREMREFLQFAAGIFSVDPSELSGDTAYGTYEKWDSLMHMNLVLSIEEKYGIEIPLAEIPEIKTLKDFYRLTLAE